MSDAIRDVIQDIKHSAMVDDHSSYMAEFMDSLAIRLESALHQQERADADCPRCKGQGKHVVGPIDCPAIKRCELCRPPSAVREG